MDHTPFIGKILVVEDDEGVSELQAVRLRRFGHFVVTSKSAEDVLQQLSSRSFDLMVLDYSLGSDMNGIALYRMLREKGINLPAVLVTGFEDPQLILNAMRSGIRDFLPKSVQYLDELPLTVERVMRQVLLEKEAHESSAIREKQEQLQAAFDAANLGYWVWDLASGDMKWSGNYASLFGLAHDKVFNSYELFIAAMCEDEREVIHKAIEDAAAKHSQFEAEFRVPWSNHQVRWLAAKGRFLYDQNDKPVQMTGVIFDINERKVAEKRIEHSNSIISALNDRLQLSITETHHRVKNDLQRIVSLLNLKLREQGMLVEEDVKKIVNHVQGFATVHDVLVDRAQNVGDTSMVSASEIVEKLLQIYSRGGLNHSICSNLAPSCFVYARQGVSLSLIVNELLANAVKHGTGKIEVILEVQDGVARLTVENEGSNFPVHFDPTQSGRAGLRLLVLLSKADLQCEPLFENTSKHTARVKLSFPILENEPLDKEVVSTPTDPCADQAEVSNTALQ